MDFLEKLEKLPRDVKEYFFSNDSRLDLEKSCFIYGVDLEKIQEISGQIGLVFVGDLALKDLPSIVMEKLRVDNKVAFGIAWEINKRMFSQFPDFFRDSQKLLAQWESGKEPPVISENEAWKKVLEIEPWIEDSKKEEVKLEEEMKQKEIVYQASLLKISIQDALKKFPEIGEQLITSEKIVLNNFPEPVRPSIKNWLSDYTFKHGYSSHTPIERGNYIFHGENGKKLNPIDREKIVWLLKAYDNDELVNINEKMRQIVLPMGLQKSLPVAEKAVQPKAGPADAPKNDIIDLKKKETSPLPAPKKSSEPAKDIWEKRDYAPLKPVFKDKKANSISPSPAKSSDDPLPEKKATPVLPPKKPEIQKIDVSSPKRATISDMNTKKTTSPFATKKAPESAATQKSDPIINKDAQKENTIQKNILPGPPKPAESDKIMKPTAKPIASSFPSRTVDLSPSKGSSYASPQARKDSPGGGVKMKTESSYVFPVKEKVEPPEKKETAEINLSSPQKIPFERIRTATEEKTVTPPPASKPARPTPQPIRIGGGRGMLNGNGHSVPPGNVVNLKE